MKRRFLVIIACVGMLGLVLSEYFGIIRTSPSPRWEAWIGNHFGIHVAFDDQGKVVDKTIVDNRAFGERSILDGLRRWLGL